MRRATGRSDLARVLAAACLVLAVAAIAVGSTSAFLSGTKAESITIATAETFAVSASVDIKPESLQLKSQGESVKAFVTLPDGWDAAGVDVGSIRLCVGTEPCGTGGVPATEVAPHDGGTSSFRADFDRASVIALVEGVETPADVVFTVSGLVEGKAFSGSDTVKVLGPDPAAEGTPTPEPSASSEPSPEPTSDPSPTADASPSEETSPEPSETPPA